MHGLGVSVGALNWGVPFLSHDTVHYNTQHEPGWQLQNCGGYNQWKLRQVLIEYTEEQVGNLLLLHKESTFYHKDVI